MRRDSHNCAKNNTNEKVLRGGFLLIILFYSFEYLRIQDGILPFLSPLKIPMLISLSLIFYILKSDKKKLSDPIFIAIIFLLLEIILWVPFAKNNFFAFQTAQNMLLTMVSVIATVLAVSTLERLRYFLGFLSLIFVVLAIWVITHGGKGPGGFVEDENDAALVLVTGLPLVAIWCSISESKKVRFFSVVGVLLVVSGIVASSSRGGFVGLVAVILLMLWFSRKRWRNLLAFVFLGFVLGGLLITLLPKGYVDDMKTIQNTNEGTANLRFLHWTTAIEIFKDNPVFGVGPDNYPWRSNEYFHLSPYFKEGARFRSGRQAHSLYFTLIPELGLMGVVIFLYLILKFNSRSKMILRKFRKKYIDKTDVSLYSMTQALRIGMAGFLISATFISVLYYPIFWHLIAIFLALENASNMDVANEP